MSLKLTGSAILIHLLFITLVCGVSAAQDNQADIPAEVQPAVVATDKQQDITTLDPVTVIGQPEDTLSGTSTLTVETLQQLPSKNGSLIEAISVLPRVQLGEEQSTSENAGEILPPKISISGGRDYENYYSIDGMGLNSLLDPQADNPAALDTVPGHPQKIFIHKDLVESVTLYDSNIPAKYGRFIGGVIDARTRLPEPDFGGKLSYRTTRDAWTRFHIHPDREEDFEQSNSHRRQPEFTKHDAGVQFDLPLSTDSGLIAAYQATRSDLEIQHIGEKKDLEKLLDNYFLKYAWMPDSPYTLELSTVYTPSEEDFLTSDTKDSDFTITRGGYAINGTLSGNLKAGKFELMAAWLSNENSREAPTDFYTWLNTGSKDWGTELGISRSREGGFGDLDTGEKSLQLSADFVSKGLAVGDTSHMFNFGVEFTNDQGSYDRKQDTHNYLSSTLDDTVVCDPQDQACAEGEQYLAARNVYQANNQDAELNHFGLYLDDTITLGRFELRPGFRISHDNFMNNTDLAHRLAGSWDIFGQGKTVFVAGHNRYYGESLLTYKLREAIEPYIRETRSKDPDSNELSDWEFAYQRTTYNSFSELDTPCSDELVFGINQVFLDGKLKLNYVERKNRDQFTREKITVNVDGEDQTHYILNNNGASDYQSMEVSWEREWQKHYLNINYVYTENESNSETYTTLFDEEDTTEEVWYEGNLVQKDELPRLDYFRPHVVNIVYVGKLPWGLTFTNVAKFRSGYTDLLSLSKSEKEARGIPTSLTAYEEGKQPKSWIFDWKLDWEKKLPRDQALVVSLEVNNVFDRKVYAGEEDDVYELGRQFWLGMSYSF
jgi:hypothetical protein